MRLLITADAVGGVWPYALDLAAALPAALSGAVDDPSADPPAGSGSPCVTLAVLGPAPDAAQRAEAAAIPGLRLVETGLPLDWLCDDPAPVLAAGAAIAALARETGAGLVHLNTPALAAGGAFAGLPVLAVNHGCLGTWWDAAGRGTVDPALAWLPELTGRGLRASGRVVAPSRAFARAVAARYALHALPAVVHNGRRPLPLPQPSAAAPFHGALTVGRLWDAVKGTATLDAAAARLAAPVVAAGALTGPHGERVAPRHLQTTGPLAAADLAGWLARRPVFVSAARFEPFGLAVLEAAQAGCALVLADIESFRELWDGAARFVAPGDAAGFADAIAALLDDPAARDGWGRAARTRAARYTAGAMAAGMAAQYRALLPQGGNGRSAA